ncbi:MAG: hypothetical protein GY810_23775 [Aureispira sp.]|nr:hypothetical protein [Aureispira sp.]
MSSLDKRKDKLTALFEKLQNKGCFLEVAFFDVLESEELDCLELSKKYTAKGLRQFYKQRGWKTYTRKLFGQRISVTDFFGERFDLVEKQLLFDLKKTKYPHLNQLYSNTLTKGFANAFMQPLYSYKNFSKEEQQKLFIELYEELIIDYKNHKTYIVLWEARSAQMLTEELSYWGNTLWSIYHPSLRWFITVLAPAQQP